MNSDLLSRLFSSTTFAVLLNMGALAYNHYARSGKPGRAYWIRQNPIIFIFPSSIQTRHSELVGDTSNIGLVITVKQLNIAILGSEKWNLSQQNFSGQETMNVNL